MALELVTVRARTRGKNPQEFQYQGVGRLTERPVLTGEKEVIKKIVDGKEVAEEVAKPVRREDGSEVKVDDIDASGLVEGTPQGLQEVISLFGTIKSETPALQRVIDGALNWFNVLQRKAASPVQEQVTEDELTPLVTELVAKGILSADDVSVWRRTITSGAKLVEMDRLEYVKMTPQYKKLKAA